jgi:hypothetical protein
MKPALPAVFLSTSIPGKRKSLEAASAGFDQILLERLVTQRVCNFECLLLPLLVFRGHLKGIAGFGEAGYSSEIAKLGIVEISEYGLRAWDFHRVPVIRLKPPGIFARVTSRTSCRTNESRGSFVMFTGRQFFPNPDTRRKTCHGCDEQGYTVCAHLWPRMIS